jgi:pimeloyl-ACP methyl ester carboxylesterase
MQSMPAFPSNKRVELYLAAGVATAPNFMSGAAAFLEKRLMEDGWTVRVRLTYPFGDWHRKLIHQLKELRHDLFLRHSSLHRSIGGTRLAAEIGHSRAEAAGHVILIGHSGGGLASIQAAYLLKNSVSCKAVIQIGSPRYPIPEELMARTQFIYGVNDRGRSSDPISRLGLWGSTRRRPALIIPVQLQGGHADYFRDTHPYRNAEGLSNLEITAKHIYDFIRYALCY